ncbi:MAG: hypothetical protein ABI831_09160 [Betaproteobacteria bacterium]
MQDVVFLFDVDNTLLDNGRIRDDFSRRIGLDFGAAGANAYWHAMIEDKLRVLTAIKAILGDRLTTVFPRQGRYATDPATIAECPPADITIGRIGELVGYDFSVIGARAGRRAVRSADA